MGSTTIVTAQSMNSGYAAHISKLTVSFFWRGQTTTDIQQAFTTQ
tara:strand:+ start:338 stop:472 length:135 start_codon:yes stop_codon:yes gene_type:complete